MDSLLPGDELHFIRSIFDSLFALSLRADGTIDHDLFKLWHFVDVFHANECFQFVALFFIEGLEDGFHDSVWLCVLSLVGRREGQQ